MAAAANVKGKGVIDDRPGVAPRHRRLREAGRDVESGQGRSRSRDFGATHLYLAHQILEQGELQSEGALGGAADARFQIAKLGRGKAHGARQGLAMNEGPGVRLGGELVGVNGGYFNEPAEHIVVP